MSEGTKAIDDLISVAKLQSDTIDRLSAGFKTIGDQIDDRPTKQIVRLLVFASVCVLTLVFSAALFLTYKTSSTTLGELKSCATFEGECYERNAQITSTAVGQVACNQEKIVYFRDPENYKVLPYCAEFINKELKRVGGVFEDTIPPIAVDKDVKQIPTL